MRRPAPAAPRSGGDPGGKKGGLWEAWRRDRDVAATQYVPIAVQWGDETTATIGTIGQVRSRGLKDPTGRPTTVQGAAAMAAFQLDSMEVAHTAGSRWADPETHQWEGAPGPAAPSLERVTRAMASPVLVPPCRAAQPHPGQCWIAWPRPPGPSDLAGRGAWAAPMAA